MISFSSTNRFHLNRQLPSQQSTESNREPAHRSINPMPVNIQQHPTNMREPPNRPITGAKSKQHITDRSDLNDRSSNRIGAIQPSRRSNPRQAWNPWAAREGVSFYALPTRLSPLETVNGIDEERARKKASSHAPRRSTVRQRSLAHVQPKTNRTGCLPTETVLVVAFQHLAPRRSIAGCFRPEAGSRLKAQRQHSS